MELRDVKKLGTSLIEEHGLIKDGWIFKLDTAKMRFGLCSFRKKVISISAKLSELNSEREVRDTILHEIAHALIGAGYGHSYKWKIKALEIGCNGKRTYGEEVLIPEKKYIGICPVCQEKYYKDRISKRRHSCGKCSRSFNLKYLIEYKISK